MACQSHFIILTVCTYDVHNIIIQTTLPQLICVMLLSCNDSSHKLLAMVISCVDLYKFFGCYFPVQPPLKSVSKLLSSTCEIPLLDPFHHVPDQVTKQNLNYTIFVFTLSITNTAAICVNILLCIIISPYYNRYNNCDQICKNLPSTHKIYIYIYIYILITAEIIWVHLLLVS